MGAVRLQHASVQVPDATFDACCAFYENAIGMQRIPNLAGRAWFRFGDGDHVHLLDGPGAPDSFGHLALQVDDLDGDPRPLPAIRSGTPRSRAHLG